jgi:hypothetical protein
MEPRDLQRRVDELEDKLRDLEARWDDEQRRARRQRQRDRWTKLAALVLVVGAYLLYVWSIVGLAG